MRIEMMFPRKSMNSGLGKALRRPLAVLLTVDTEVYPLSANWRGAHLRADIDRDIYGKTGKGEYGLLYQLKAYARYGIKGTFFVESLFARCPDVGLEPLRRIVSEIQEHGQEVQLHLHPEWIPHLSDHSLKYRGHLIRDYPEDEQTRLIDMAAENLVKAGAKFPLAFRAGDFAANEETLRALERVGILIDSSYDYPYTRRTCGLHGIGPTWDARRVGALWEVPVSCFAEGFGRFRHCQLTACSTTELATAMGEAVRAGWKTFTVVNHSFEMLANRRSANAVAPRWSRVRRFHALCEFLATCKEIATTHFNDLILSESGANPIQGSLINTAVRMSEQALTQLMLRVTRGRWS